MRKLQNTQTNFELTCFINLIIKFCILQPIYLCNSQLYIGQSKSRNFSGIILVTKDAYAQN